MTLNKIEHITLVSAANEAMSIVNVTYRTEIDEYADAEDEEHTENDPRSNVIEYVLAA